MARSNYSRTTHRTEEISQIRCKQHRASNTEDAQYAAHSVQHLTYYALTRNSACTQRTAYNTDTDSEALKRNS